MIQVQNEMISAKSALDKNIVMLLDVDKVLSGREVCMAEEVAQNA